jgi:hypothetical protein
MNFCAARGSTRWYNNIFYVEGTATYNFGDSTNNIFEANCFYGNHIDPPSDPYAITSNPFLLDPGSGGFGLDSVDGYQLAGSSPCINAGRDTGIPYNHPDHINGGIDYWGNPLPEDPLMLDIGAHETSGEPSYCGDGTCDPGEDQCNCSDDCGNPPATETNCTDGITVEYDRKAEKYDEGEGCLVEWYDGADWNLIELAPNMDWGHASFELPSGANDNPNFRIRFTGNGNHTLEKSYLDNVEILY